MVEHSPGALFSIGHSNHPWDHFVGLLKEHAIGFLVDVRSSPYSRFANQFNREDMEPRLCEHGIRYLFLGCELGGRPDGDQFYDSEGHVLYDRVAASPEFQAGIERLQNGARTFRVAIMCSEEDPTSCHRELLIGRVLDDLGARLQHIRGDGRIESGADLVRGRGAQIPLFGGEAWRSTRSVSQRRTPASSSPPSEKLGSSN